MSSTTAFTPATVATAAKDGAAVAAELASGQNGGTTTAAYENTAPRTLGSTPQGTPASVASPMLKQQMAAWTRVIDQAEKEIARKSSESQFLKNKLRQAEFEVANKVRRQTETFMNTHEQRDTGRGRGETLSLSHSLTHTVFLSRSIHASRNPSITFSLSKKTRD